jgi:hypothetical protein
MMTTTMTMTMMIGGKQVVPKCILLVQYTSCALFSFVRYHPPRSE